jgi:hypothetical protein
MTVEEIGVKLRRPTYMIAVVMPNGGRMSNWPAFEHNLLRITSRRTSKQWVFDICGAQYGIYEPFHPWVQYQTRYVERETAIFDPGFLKTLLADLAQIRGNTNLSYGLVGEAARVLDTAVNTWESQNQALFQLRTLDNANFSQQKASLLNAIDNAVRNFTAIGSPGPGRFAARVRSEKRFEARQPSAPICFSRTAELRRRANRLGFTLS